MVDHHVIWSESSAIWAGVCLLPVGVSVVNSYNAEWGLRLQVVFLWCKLAAMAFIIMGGFVMLAQGLPKSYWHFAGSVQLYLVEKDVYSLRLQKLEFRLQNEICFSLPCTSPPIPPPKKFQIFAKMLWLDSFLSSMKFGLKAQKRGVT